VLGIWMNTIGGYDMEGDLTYIHIGLHSFL
jgi:hypothetical protein